MRDRVARVSDALHGARRTLLLVAAVLVAAASSQPASAQAQVTGLTGWSGSGLSAVDNNFGFEFSTTLPIRITELGFYDVAGDGLAAAHAVGIWDASTQNLLVSATVPAGSVAPLDGGYRYVSVSPTDLPAGNYIVSAVTTGDAWLTNLVSPTMSSPLSYVAGRSLFPVETAALVFPNQAGGNQTAPANFKLVVDPVPAAPCNVPSASHPTIQDAVDDPSCSRADLGAGLFTGPGIVIDRDFEIVGVGAASTRIGGNPSPPPGSEEPVLTLLPAATPGARTVTLRDLTVRDGVALNGGGIYNDGVYLVLDDCIVEDNAAIAEFGEGGGIFNTGGGFVELIGTTVRNNTATFKGGGISNSGFDSGITDPNTLQTIRDKLDDARDTLAGVEFSLPTTPTGFLDFGQDVVDLASGLTDTFDAIFVDSGLLDGFVSLLEGGLPGGSGGSILDDLSFAPSAIKISAGSVITGNRVDSTASPLPIPGFGGGVYSEIGAVLIENSTISANSVEAQVAAYGGGIAGAVSATSALNSVVQDNWAEAPGVYAGGGGIFNLGGILYVEDTAVRRNEVRVPFLGYGAGVFNFVYSDATFVRANIHDNVFPVGGFEGGGGGGGGLSNGYAATARLIQTRVHSNEVRGAFGAFGGGIHNDTGGTVELVQSEVSDNRAVGLARGAGIFNYLGGNKSIQLFTGDQMPPPLPVWNTTTIRMENSTISNNEADGTIIVAPFPLPVPPITVNNASRGAGVYNHGAEAGVAPIGCSGSGPPIATSYPTGKVFIENSTIAENRLLGNSRRGAGLFDQTQGSLILGNPLSVGCTRTLVTNSLVVGNTGAADCQAVGGVPAFFRLDSFGLNVDSDASCNGRADIGAFVTDAAVGVAPLASNGGPTRTHPLFATSLAFDAAIEDAFADLDDDPATPAELTVCPAVDQRDVDRSLGGLCDAGAYETLPATSTPDDYQAIENNALVVPASQGVNANDGIAVLSTRVDQAPANGVLVLEDDGGFVYTPDPEYVGPDVFFYTATTTTLLETPSTRVDLDVVREATVVSVIPAASAVGIDPSANIEIELDLDALDTGFIPPNGITIHGQSSGYVAALNTTVGSRYILDPLSDFLTGERVTVTISAGLRTVDGGITTENRVVEFVVATSGGGGVFTDAGQPEGGTLHPRYRRGVVVGDLNNDDRPDAVVWGGPRLTGGGLADQDRDGESVIWLGAGDGSFFERGLAGSPQQTSGVAIGDILQDGYPDLFVTNNAVRRRDDSSFQIPCTVAEITLRPFYNEVLFNNGGAGTDFAPTNQQLRLSTNWAFDRTQVCGAPFPGGQNLLRVYFDIASSGVALGDVDGDGDLDAFVISAGTLMVLDGPGIANSGLLTEYPPYSDTIWLNDGFGNFSDSGQRLGNARSATVDLVDLDGDGDLDAYVGVRSGGGQGPDQTWINDGTGVFTAGPTASADVTSGVAVGDLDGDGLEDVLVAIDNSFNDNQVWLNQSGTLVFDQLLADDPTQNDTALDAALGDLDGDGDLDGITLGGGNDSLSSGFVWMNDGGTLSLPAEFSVFPGTPELEETGQIALGDFDQDGDLDAFVVELDDLSLIGGRRGGRVLLNQSYPTTEDDLYVLPEDGSITVGALLGVLANDFDTDAGTTTFTASVATSPGQGQLTAFAPDGSFDYVPDPDFSGTDTFTYSVSDGLLERTATVSLDVTPINDAPVAVDDLDYEFTRGQPFVVVAAQGVLQNDIDVDGDVPTPVLSQDAANGTLDLQPDGAFTYTPDPGYLGTDDFFYLLDDGQATSNVARVKLGNTPPAPTSGTVYALVPGTQLVVDAASGILAGVDPDGDTLTITVVEPPTNGTFVVAADGSFVYTPDPGYLGTDAFRFSVNDGLVESPVVRVKLGNTAPDAQPDPDQAIFRGDTLVVDAANGVLANDSDADGDPITLVLDQTTASGALVLQPDGAFSYTPPSPTFVGTETFVYHLEDGFVSSAAVTVTIRVVTPLTILDRQPAANAVGVFPGSDVVITFDEPPADPDDAVLRLALIGSQSGPVSFQASLAQTPQGWELSLDPDADFLPGERVSVSAPLALQYLPGPSDTLPEIWQFDVGAAGAGPMTALAPPLVGDTQAEDVALADLDGDGDLDAVVADRLGPDEVFVNDGAGGFAERRIVPDGAFGLGRVHLGDLDGDGDVDLFSVNQIWLNDGAANFTLSPNGTTFGSAEALADLDGDGDLDLFFGRSGGGLGVGDAVWLNDGNGSFTDSGQALGAANTLDVALGDLDGDGDLDAITTHNRDTGPPVADQVWLNDGTGQFVAGAQTFYAGTTERMERVELADLDGDGHLDAFFSWQGEIGTSRHTWFGQGDGTFVEGSQDIDLGILIPGYELRPIFEFGDLDGDGDVDLFVSATSLLGPEDRDTIWLNQGDGTFVATYYLGANIAGAVALGDLDGDGALDAFVGTKGGITGPAVEDVVWLPEPDAPLLPIAGLWIWVSSRRRRRR